MSWKLDLIKQTVASAPGTGTISLGSALTGYIGIQNHPDSYDGMLVEYSATDGNNKEFGIGTYSTTGTTLARTWIQGKLDTGTFTKDPGIGLTLSASTVVRCSPIARNFEFKGCLLTHSTTQSIPDATATSLNWDSEEYDTDGFHDTVTNNSRITIPSNKGIEIVQFYAGIDWAANGASYRMARIFKNGGTFNGGAASMLFVNTATTNCFHNVITPPIHVTGGDYFEVNIYQPTGSALNVNDTTYAHFFGMMVIK